MAQRFLKRTISIVMVIGLMAVGCAGQKAASTQEEPPVVSAVYGNVVTATGKAVPAQWAALSFETGGRVEWLVAEGSHVEAGEVLARLDATDLEHTAAQARAALAVVQAQLAAAKAGATPEETAGAEAAVVTAQGGVAAAEVAVVQAEIGAGIARINLKQAKGAVAVAEAALTQGQGIRNAAVAALTQAQGSLDAAGAGLIQAEAELARLQTGARPEEIVIHEARVEQAKWELWFLTNVHKQLIDNDIGGAPEEQARFQREAAQAAYDAAQAQLDLVKAGATNDEIVAAKAGVSAAQAQVTVAGAGIDAAEAALAQAQGALDAAEADLARTQAALEAVQGQVELAEMDVTAAEAQVQIAEGQLAQAEAQRDRLEAGVTTEEIAVLEAQVSQTEATLAQAESALAKATLIAPFAGTVGAVHLREGEMTAPGTPVLVLGDVSALRVEITDLNEVDVAQVAVGSPVTLTFDALPEQLVKGQVVRIAPMASVGQGGTNFTTVVEMNSPPAELRWGMTVFVDIEVDR